MQLNIIVQKDLRQVKVSRMCFLALRLLLDQMQLQNGDICLA